MAPRFVIGCSLRDSSRGKLILIQQSKLTAKYTVPEKDKKPIGFYSNS